MYTHVEAVGRLRTAVERLTRRVVNPNQWAVPTAPAEAGRGEVWAYLLNTHTVKKTSFAWGLSQAPAV